MTIAERFKVSDVAPLSEQRDPNAKRVWVNFIPNIDFGHLLTILGFIVAMVVQWNSMDKKQAILEQQIAQLVAADIVNRNQARENVKDIQADVKDIKDSVGKLTTAVSVIGIRVDMLSDRKGK